jgi:deoxyuridine 5'-triphosphate nucleotidohydrolase
VDTRVRVQRHHQHSQLPRKAHPSDACYDLFSPEAQVVTPGSQAVVDTGLSIELECGWEAQVRGRSGLSRRGIHVHFGTIDHLYRGPLKLLLTNHSGADYSIEVGDRVAQLKFERVYEVELVEAPVTLTERGGLGSTGR